MSTNCENKTKNFRDTHFSQNTIGITITYSLMLFTYLNSPTVTLTVSLS